MLTHKYADVPCLEVTLSISLTRPSFNFVPLGQSRYCVQDWEGYLSVYQNERMVQAGRQRHFTLPGPMAICPDSEDILVASGQILSRYSIGAIPDVHSDAIVIYVRLCCC